MGTCASKPGTVLPPSSNSNSNSNSSNSVGTEASNALESDTLKLSNIESLLEPKHDILMARIIPIKRDQQKDNGRTGNNVFDIGRIFGL
jgi:hypothetical protein